MNDRLPQVVRQLRQSARMTARDLAARTYVSYTWLSNVEHSRRWPSDRQWAVAADQALGGHGRITAAWDEDNGRRHHESETCRMLKESAAATETLLRSPEAADTDDV